MNQLEAIQAARRVIADTLQPTPARRMDGSAFGLDGVTLVFKLEMFQPTGSFKIRGVLNTLRSLSTEQKASGVLGMSSGNHAQALAFGARLEGIDATLIMPAYSIPEKIEATKALGARVEIVEASELLEAYDSAVRERGLTAVHPFDDPLIIAGAGTAALELLDDAPEVDTALVSVGGGGWLSGSATAFKLAKPGGVRVIGAEPEGACAVRRSLDAGRLVRLDSVNTVADGLAPPFTGEHCLDRIQRYVDEVVVVTDQEILDAMRAIIEKVKVLVEPSGAAGLAALLSGKIDAPSGSTVAVMLSGGNISLERLKSLPLWGV